MNEVPIVSVLRSGGEYRPEHAIALAAQVPHLTLLTDIDHDWPTNITPVKMRRAWPGWWSKLELFEAFPEALYFDLDTVIIKDVSRLFAPRGHDSIWALRDLYADPPSRRFGSGVMAWRGDYRHITQTFARHADYVMTSMARGGDQLFLEQMIGPDFAPFQDHHPGFIVSFKRHVKPNGSVVGHGVGVVCYHGKPRPWDPRGVIRGFADAR